uniref:Uncharacterized protein n=1 Tax=Rhizophora mucronata TaxID=61149 RepID=A0A2P2PHA2_RHIMU
MIIKLVPSLVYAAECLGNVFSRVRELRF